MRKFAVILGITLIVFSSAGILLATRYRDNLRMQRLLARFWIGSDDPLLDAADALKKRGTPDGLQAAADLYREVLSRDAANPSRWCNLGAALQDSGRAQEALYCFRRAAELGPNNIQTLWRVAEFYTQVQQPHEALRCMAHILKLAPDAAESVFYSYTTAGFDFSDTLNYGLPPVKPIAQSYCRYILRSGNMINAEQCWSWLSERSMLDDKLAGEYAAFWFRVEEYRKARDAWAAYLGARGGAYLQSNFLYDAGFESEPGRSPFDWKISETPGAEVARDPAVCHSGQWSLRIVFDGKQNPEYRHVNQTAFLEPGAYRFAGCLRTEGITTDQGIGFRILQLTPPSRLDIRTEQLTKTSDWRVLEKTFELAEPGLVRVEVFRQPSWKFDNKIAGTAWVDDLELSPVKPVKP